MSITLTIKDESSSGKITNEVEVHFLSELTSVKDIIQKRVESEVKNYNKRMPEYYQGLIQPSDSEKTLNGFKLKQRKKIDIDKQCSIALEAFKKNGFFILIDSIQSEGLDQMIIINEKTRISFLKLTPLVGG